MSRRQTLELRLELLRVRGALERAEAAGAAAGLRSGARRFGAIASLVSAAGGALAGGGGWASVLAGALGARPLSITVAVVALRTLRRHPVIAIAAAGGVLAFLALRRRASPPPAAEADSEHD